jgi:hypothetical protein
MLRLIIVGVRLRLIGWRIEQAREERDHRGLLRLTENWHELYRRTFIGLGRDAPPGRDRDREAFCERVRRTVPLIEREQRRIAWVLARMERARAAEDERAYDRSQSVGLAARRRLTQLWAQL